MSTILKSLKKLEQEKEATRYPVQAGPGTVAASGGPSRWTKVTWIRRSIVVVLILGLGATTLYFYKQTQSQPSTASAPPKAAQPPVNKIAKGTIKKRVQPDRTEANPQATQAQKIQKQDRRPAVVSVPKPNAVDRQGDPTLPVVVPSQRPSEKAVPAPTRKPAMTPAERPSQPSKLPTRRQQRKPIPAVRPENQPSTATVQNSGSITPQKRTQPSDTYDGVRPLTDGRLKIHAIVWSDNQQDRMAVINTQILHEGDTVSGFAIVAIRSDDVVVRGEGGGLHRILFGRP